MNSRDNGFSLERFLPYLVHRVGSRLADGFSDRFEARGVSLQEWRALSVLYEYGPQAMGDIARRTSLPASSMTRLIGGMEKRGLVRRERQIGNQRTVYVRLLADGRAIAESLIPDVIDYEKELGECFSAAEMQTFKTLLAKMFHSLTDDDRSEDADGNDRLAG